MGGHAADALARAGVGRLVLVDFDKVCITNVNRQLVATRGTVRRFKAELMAEHVRDVNAKAQATPIVKFYDPETADEILADGYDVVLDCIDNMTAKVDLLATCHARGQYVISSMGRAGASIPRASASPTCRRPAATGLPGSCALLRERGWRPGSRRCGPTSRRTTSIRRPRRRSAASAPTRT
ncbi:MAG: ThiF family adenylyltransferase [Myxococcota bacterium]